MNYYEILKIQKNASKQQIKSSYKNLVKQYHPDLYRGDKDFAEQKIKEINEAYSILSNPEKKAEYDEYLNPTITPTMYYTSTTNSQSTATATDTANPSADSESKWSFSKFIAEKFNHLDKKRQLQIFILILILFLALFLINLIEVKYYLNNIKTTNSTNTLNTTNNTVEEYNYSEFPEIPFDDTDEYESNDFKTLDDLLYDLFLTYENNSFSDYENNDFEFENSY